MFHVLFLCTGNSARSLFAEALTNHLRVSSAKFRAFSGGSQPAGAVHPLTLAVLTEQRIPIEGLRSKSWNEFAGAGAPPLDFVFTVCDAVAAEPCPRWPGRQPMIAHWSVPDPAAATGTDEEQRKAFRDAFLVLKRRIELFASLPLEKLSGLALREELQRIGQERLESEPQR